MIARKLISKFLFLSCTYPNNGLLASIALRSKVFVVVFLTVEFASLLNEPLVLQRLTTSSTSEVIWMPRPPNGTNKRPTIEINEVPQIINVESIMF